MAEERAPRYDDEMASGRLGQIYSYALQPELLATTLVRRRANRSYLINKRIFDVLSSICLLVVIWPIFLMIAAAIKIDSKGPVIYRHKRIGQHGKDVYIYKFRSMVENADSLITRFTPDQMREWRANYKLTRDPRITKVGAFLRKTSLDELPQLLNILQGSLSVVGPRPIVQDELEKYGGYKWFFMSAKPGLTGYWQAYARNDCSYEERIQMELEYISKADMWFDLKIICATFAAVIKCKGAL